MFPLQGAYLARLGGAELGAGVAAADVLQRVLRGWSGLDVSDVDAQVRCSQQLGQMRTVHWDLTCVQIFQH